MNRLISLLATGVLLLNTARPLRAAATNDASNPSPVPATAWAELQKAAHAIKPAEDDQTKEAAKQHAAAAVNVANQAKDFATRFPDSKNVIDAKKLRCQMLEMAFYDENDRNVLADWGQAQQALLTDPNLTEPDRFKTSYAIVQRKRFDSGKDERAKIAEREKDLRTLIKNYPKEDKPYMSLLALAANSPEAKARSIANEILALPVSDMVRLKANGVLRRFDAPGKPLDLQFTAFDGREVDLGKMKGKVVLIDFWATWCGPCVAEIPHVKQVYEQLHPDGFEVIGLSFDSDRQDLQRFLDKNKLPWPQYFDGKGWTNKYGVQFGISGIPAVWLVDKKGVLRELNARNDLEAKVKKLMAE